MNFLIIGKMKFEVYTEYEGVVSFYLDDIKYYSDINPPYEWNYNISTLGKHEIRAEIQKRDGTVAYAKLEALIIKVV